MANRYPLIELPLDEVLAAFRNGDSTSWVDEFNHLRENDADLMNELIRDIHMNGIQEPILLGADGRIWDGHHRLFAAVCLNLTTIPVRWA